jgi:hypothetical protein
MGVPRWAARAASLANGSGLSFDGAGLVGRLLHGLNQPAQVLGFFSHEDAFQRLTRLLEVIVWYVYIHQLHYKIRCIKTG